MDFEFQTICVVRPLYFTIAVLLLLGTAIASAISVIIAIKRRISGTKVLSHHLSTFHASVVVVWAMFAVVMGIGWVRDRHVLQDYEQTAGREASAVRAAMNRETKTVAMFGVGCVVVGLSSMLAWRGVAQRAPADRVP